MPLTRRHAEATNQVQSISIITNYVYTMSYLGTSSPKPDDLQKNYFVILAIQFYRQA